MIQAWILYIFLLLGSFAFFVFYTEYISFFLFAAVLLFPLFSLLLFLLGKRKLRLRFLPGSPAAQKGETCSFLLEAEKPFFLPLVKCRIRLTLHNTFSGELLTQGLEFPLVSRRTRIPIPCVSGCCGRVVFSLSKCRIFDFTRLFSAPLTPPQPEAAFFLPSIPVYEPAGENFAPAEGVEDSNPRRRGSDPSETFDLRSWQEGDRLRDVHWKLTARTGDTIVREHASPARPPLKLYIRFCGSAAERDGTLEAAAALGLAFCASGLPIEFLWEDHSGEKAAESLCSFLLQDQKELVPCLEALLSSVPGTGTYTAEPFRSGEPHIFLSGPVSLDELKQHFLLAGKFPRAVLTVTEQDAPHETVLHGSGFSFLRLQPGRIEEGLRLFTLCPEGGSVL